MNQDKAEMVKLLSTLFTGNPSCYGKETPTRPICIHESLTDQTFLNHIEGRERIGIYPLVKDKITFGSVDFDETPWEQIGKFIAACVDKNFYPQLERSKSRELGIHNHFFFDRPTLAKDFRKVMDSILLGIGLDPKSIEIFPKQDTIPDDGVGNFIFLPLHGESIKQDRTVLLDFNFNSYPDQLKALKSIYRTKAEEIVAFAKSVTIVTPIPEPRMMPAQTENNSLGSLDVERYLNHYGIKSRVKLDIGRTFSLLDRCLFADQHTTPSTPGDSSIVQGADGKLGYQCFHKHCALKTWADARKIISRDDPIFQFCEGYTQSPPDLKPPTIERGLPKDLFEIIDEPETIEVPLIENLLYPGDKGFIVSMYKMGKTLFLMQMALCLSMAVPFLGFGIPKARKVLFIRFELKDSRFRKRLNIMLPALGGREKVQITPYFHMTRGFDIKNEKDFSWLLNMIYKFEPELLFLDPFYKLSITSNLKDPESANPIIRKFDNLMGRFPDLHVPIAHHLRKQSGGIKDDSWDSAYGPMQLFADMDYEIRISRKGAQKDTFVFSHISNDVPIENFTFKRNSASLLYELETTDDIQNRWLQTCDKVVSQVQNGGEPFRKKGNLKTWMQTELKYSQRDAKDCLDYLLENKKLIWVGGIKKGHLEAPQPIEEGFDNPEGYKNGLFS